MHILHTLDLNCYYFLWSTVWRESTLRWGWGKGSNRQVQVPREFEQLTCVPWGLHQGLACIPHFSLMIGCCCACVCYGLLDVTAQFIQVRSHGYFRLCIRVVSPGLKSKPGPVSKRELFSVKWSQHYSNTLEVRTVLLLSELSGGSKRSLHAPRHFKHHHPPGS